MGDFHIQGKDLNSNAKLNSKELKELGLDKKKDYKQLHTLFDRLDIDVNLNDGLSTKEAKAIMGLFDSDTNNNITQDELSYENLMLFVAENAGGKYARDEKFMNPLTALVDGIKNKVTTGSVAGAKIPNEGILGDPISRETFITENANGEVNGGYNLDTIGGVTTKTNFGVDGTENKSVTEKWEAGFKNYEKVWTAPNGEKSILKAAGEVTANADGTFNVPVKKTGLGASDEIFVLVLDKNGNEINRFDATGNKYDSTGSLTAKSFTTKDADGKINGGYELDLTGGTTKKIRYGADGSIKKCTSEEWGNNFQNYKKEWNGPNGEKTVLEYTNAVDNGDGTFTVSVKRIDSRFPEQNFTLIMDSDGNELDRYDEDGNHYDSTGVLLTEKTAEEVAPEAIAPAGWIGAAGTIPKAYTTTEVAAPTGFTVPDGPAPEISKPGSKTKNTKPKKDIPEARFKPSTQSGLKKAGMYWAKTEVVNGHIVKSLYYDESGTRLHSKKIENDTSGKKRKEFYSEAGEKTSSIVKNPNENTATKKY